MHVTVDLDGHPWIISATAHVYKYSQSGWLKIESPPLKKITSGQEGSILALDGGKAIWKWSGKEEKWREVGGAALVLAVGGAGKPYAIGEEGLVSWPEENCSFPSVVAKPVPFEKIRLPPCRTYDRVIFKARKSQARDIAVSADGSIFALAKDYRLR
jgi:hypothetical protein